MTDDAGEEDCIYLAVGRCPFAVSCYDDAGDVRWTVEGRRGELHGEEHECEAVVDAAESAY